MAVAVWIQKAAVAAGAAYAVPAGSGLPASDTIVGVETVTISPLASAGAASVVSPIQEAGVANNTAAPAAGDVSAQIATQQLISGDAIPADSLMTAVVVMRSERPTSP